jgi:hypothetical protein
MVFAGPSGISLQDCKAVLCKFEKYQAVHEPQVQARLDIFFLSRATKYSEQNIFPTAKLLRPMYRREARSMACPKRTFFMAPWYYRL